MTNARVPLIVCVEVLFENKNQREIMITPYDYQYECLNRIETHLTLGKRIGLVVMAMGLGKTVVAAFDVKRHFVAGGGRVLYLCHMIDILYQARSEFEAIIGSGKSFGFFHGGEKTMKEVDCLFATFETIGNWLDMFEPTEFEYIIVDESHHSHAETYFKTIRHFTPKFLLGMTGTPYRLDQKDIRTIYGEPLFNLPLEEALGKGYLTPVDYRILTDEISIDEILKDPNRRWSIHALNRSIFIPKRDEEIASIIAREVKSIECPKTIVFCPSVRYCNHFTTFMPDSLTIHSGISWKERDVRLEMFRQDMLDTVLAVDCFNEGIDIPRANVLVFLRSSASRRIFLQQLGRGLRKSKGKDKVVVLDFVGNIQRIRHIEEMVRSAQEFIKAPRVAEKEKVIAPPPITLEVGRVRFNEERIPFTELLGRIVRQEPYATWQEASAAAIQLGITSMPDYVRRYSIDPKLPSNPRKTYAHQWPRWYRFLGKERRDNLYPTWQEASALSLKLGITSQSDYRRLYKRNPRLPGHPVKYYKNWPGWYAFFGKEKPNPYPTWQESSAAAVKIGIANARAYKYLRRRDSRLPGNPFYTYRDFPGWLPFLQREEPEEKFATWQEAAAVVVPQKVDSKTEYRRRYKELDARLPHHPERYYTDFPGWPVFLSGKKRGFYATYAAAAYAARKLKFKNCTEYLRGGYKKDSLLPADPAQKYGYSWRGWSAFLKKPSNRNRYQTYEEAMGAVRQYCFAGRYDYQHRCKSCDAKLPVAPNEVYSDFPGWDIYLGKK